MKKALSCILALSLVFGCAAALPEGSFEGGICITAQALEGGGFIYELSGDNATITGYKGLPDVVIPAELDGHKVIAVKENTFKNNDSISSVYISSGISIGKQAFSGCDSIGCIIIENGCTVGELAFENCGYIGKAAFFGDSVISADAFINSEIGHFYCEEGTKPEAFAENLGLDIDYIDGTHGIGDAVFGVFEIYDYGDEIWIKRYNGDAANVEVPGQILGRPVTTIDDKAFMQQSYNENYSLVSVKLPDSVTQIRYDAFFKCVNLESINLEKVLWIGPGAFCKTAIGNTKLNKDVEIGVSAFSECGMTEAFISKSMTAIFEDIYSFNPIKEVNIPKWITRIDPYAFYNTDIKDVFIPPTVTFIDDKAFGYYDSYHIDEETGEEYFDETKKYEDMVIRGYDGTGAEQYAKDNGFEFISLGKYTAGDVNGDGKFDLSDVVTLKQFIASWKVNVDKFAADVNCDGTVDIKDVVLIKQKLANWNVEIA